MNPFLHSLARPAAAAYVAHMCGRYSLTVTKKDLRERFPDAAGDLFHNPRYNIAPTQRAPALCADAHGAPCWRMLKWGFHGAGGRRIINARVETLSDRPLFRGLLERQRCLLPADGFYEWSATDGGRGTRAPWRFLRKDQSVFAFAGLWTPAAIPAAEGTYVLLTTRPNALVRPVHERMPILLPDDLARAWLDPTRPFTTVRNAVAQPFDAERMEAYPVAAAVNSVTNDTSECIAREVRPVQGRWW